VNVIKRVVLVKDRRQISISYAICFAFETPKRGLNFPNLLFLNHQRAKTPKYKLVSSLLKLASDGTTAETENDLRASGWVRLFWLGRGDTD
jgi:hypothetical protein